MKYYLSALIVLSIVLVAHLVGLQGYYLTISVYDTFMHILGGAGIALFLIAVAHSLGLKGRLNWKLILLGVLLIGLVWELFEMYYELTGHPLWTKWYYIDTVKDFINDIIGGGLVAWFYDRSMKRVEERDGQKVSRAELAEAGDGD